MKLIKKSNLARIALLAFAIWCVSPLKADGLPLPWPFPWAKECPIYWPAVDGRYTLTNSQSQKLEIDMLKISDQGLSLVRVARIDQQGQVRMELTFVSQDLNTLRVKLVSTHDDDAVLIAKIRFHYSNSDMQCTQDQLVPILTLESLEPQTPSVTQYQLIREPDCQN